MKSLKDYVMVFENIINNETCKKIIDTYHNGDWQKGYIGNSKESDIRKCYLKYIDKDFEKDIFKSVGLILKLYGEAHPYFNTGETIEDTGYEHLVYLGAENGEYKEHVDHFDLAPRVLSCSFILNDDYDGGDFAFFGAEHIVKKQKGSAVVFPSNFCFPHAITPVSNGNRHSIITWIH